MVTVEELGFVEVDTLLKVVDFLVVDVFGHVLVSVLSDLH